MSNDSVTPFYSTKRKHYAVCRSVVTTMLVFSITASMLSDVRADTVPDILYHFKGL
ncbi:hypothetical protein BDV28DRAFT_133409 [Aspergillus coremiiformis]|uniref:Uncharacterized protein n=1 Tax=Aspergillus coremiiformis TaxID=138285 RepID=A0A5N6Z8S4_9EURO|nr:hypothetical protein BDV28DRAFT_133409 [Aspergillus coremiiformis]